MSLSRLVLAVLVAVAVARAVWASRKEGMSGDDRQKKKYKRWFTRRQRKECGEKPDGGCDGVWKCAKKDGSDELFWKCHTHQSYCDKLDGHEWKDGKCLSPQDQCERRGLGYFWDGDENKCRNDGSMSGS